MPQNVRSLMGDSKYQGGEVLDISMKLNEKVRTCGMLAQNMLRIPAMKALLCILQMLEIPGEIKP